MRYKLNKKMGKPITEYSGKLVIDGKQRRFSGKCIHPETEEKVFFSISSFDKTRVSFNTLRKNGQIGRFRGYFSIPKYNGIEILY